MEPSEIHKSIRSLRLFKTKKDTIHSVNGIKLRLNWHEIQTNMLIWCCRRLYWHIAQSSLQGKSTQHGTDKKKADDFPLQKLYSADKNPPAFGSSSSPFLDSSPFSSRSRRGKRNKPDTFVISPSDWGKCPFFPTRRQMEGKVYQTQLSTEQWKIEICDRKVQSSSGSSKKPSQLHAGSFKWGEASFLEGFGNKQGRRQQTRTYGPGGGFLKHEWINQKEDRSSFLTAVQH